MNKYQEALKKIKSDFWDDPAYYGLEEEFNLLQELVDKETPMEVNMEDYHLEDEYQYPIYNCPKCGKHLNDEDSYCRHCGQKLDWSEE